MFRNRRDASAPGSPEGSVYERVLGERFAGLDPRLRAYFGRIPVGSVGIGEGVFRDAGLRTPVLRPVFALLGRAHIAFAERGRDVPFTLRNSPAPDGVLDAVRTFRFAGVEREMRDSIRVVGDRLVDRVGTRGRMEVELELRVSAGRLFMQSRRLAVHVAGVRLPLPPVVRLDLCEQTVSREHGTQQVDVRMTAPILGEIYGYSGTFTYAVRAGTE